MHPIAAALAIGPIGSPDNPPMGQEELIRGRTPMAIASAPSSLSPIAASAKSVPQRPAATDAEWWVTPLRWTALATFGLIPIGAYLAEAYAGRIVWTVAIAVLPLFIVLIGYHRWRRICPLASIAQIPLYLGRPGKRRASTWLEGRYYYIPLTIFVLSLWLRLIATNGDGQALAAFFIVLSLAALVFGLFYTGKTWCNYICPVSFIEKIYTEPHGLRETPNSQCPKCTACKKTCPDINEENGYWKEIDLRPKRLAYFTFPGLVFGFYFYYYLQAGTWEYYFSGQWTRQPGLIYTAFLPGWNADTAGLFFLPSVPRALAALLTLALSGAVSWWAFSRLEEVLGNWLRRRYPEVDSGRVRHLMFTFAAFAAFITFYSFAGAPTLRLAPPLQHLFLIVVMLTAALFLVRRLRRTQQVFAEETLARSMIKHWEWSDIQPPKDLHDAFLIHTIRARESKKGYEQLVEVYKNAVRDTLAHGFITREEVQHLESLRSQLHIKEADHAKVMAALAEEERALISDPGRQVSAEKRLQLDTYARALENYLQSVFAAEGRPDDSFIAKLRSEYHVTQEEHAAILDEVLGGAGAMAARLTEEILTAERAALALQTLECTPSPAHGFLADLLRRRLARALDALMRGLSLERKDEVSRALLKGLSSTDRALRKAAVERFRATVTPSVAERVESAYNQAARQNPPPTTMQEVLQACLSNVDPYVRAAAAYILCTQANGDETLRAAVLYDEHELVREIGQRLQEQRDQGGVSPPTDRPLLTIEKMLALRTAPLFSTLAPESLVELARASVEAEYAPGETLCVEGEPGNEAFIVLAGEAEVLRGQGPDAQVIATERTGALIGELAVLDPAPRAATLRAAPHGVRVLRLDGQAFRDALNADPAIAAEVIRILAQRMREGTDLPSKSKSVQPAVSAVPKAAEEC